MIYAGDNLDVMRRLAGQGFRADLVYMDPPFRTGRTFVCDGRIAYVDPSDPHAWRRQIHERLRALYPLLQPHASVVVHLDHHAEEAMRSLAAPAFGPPVAEIIWRYRRWPSPSKMFQRVHDTLLVYRANADAEHRWNQLYEPHAPSTLATWGTKRQRARVVAGKRVRSEVGEEESPGVPMGDVWDIGILAPSSKERTGYPTQKPEALLERIIGALSNEGDVVLDPYMGSGTTLVVAKRMGRIGVGIDSSPVAIEVASARLGEEAA